MFIPGQVFQPGHCYITHIDVTIGYSIFTKCHLLSQSINKDIQPKFAQTVGLQQVRFFFWYAPRRKEILVHILQFLYSFIQDVSTLCELITGFFLIYTKKERNSCTLLQFLYSCIQDVSTLCELIIFKMILFYYFGNFLYENWAFAKLWIFRVRTAKSI